MRHIAIVVEGQTEEAFVKEVLAPAFIARDIYLQPIIVATSIAANGSRYRGGGGWTHYQRMIKRLLAEQHWYLVTTMIDFYAYPSDAPGAECMLPHRPRECAAHRVEAIMDAFDHDRRLLPFVMLHEFETLVFAAAMDRRAVLEDEGVGERLRDECKEVGGDVELLNDSPQTAPSKRIKGLWPDYQKVTDGVEVIREAGLAHVRERCPGFDFWLDQLES